MLTKATRPGTISLAATVPAGDSGFELSDIGKKVDVSLIAPRRLEDIRPGGLGTHFMNTVFDSVQYDTAGPRARC